MLLAHCRTSKKTEEGRTIVPSDKDSASGEEAEAPSEEDSERLGSESKDKEGEQSALLDGLDSNNKTVAAQLTAEVCASVLVVTSQTATIAESVYVEAHMGQAQQCCVGQEESPANIRRHWCVTQCTCLEVLQSRDS